MGSPAVSPSHDPLSPRPRLRPRHQRARMRSRSACRCLSSRRVRRRHRRALKTPPSVVRRPRLRLLVMSSRRAPTPFSTIWTTKAVSLVAPSTPSRTPVHSLVYGTIITTTTTLRKARRPTEGLLWRIVGRLIHYLSSSHAPHPVPPTRCRTTPPPFTCNSYRLPYALSYPFSLAPLPHLFWTAWWHLALVRRLQPRVRRDIV